ncbi:MAG: Gfo/Idh/MocA family oxidoreductase [Victivallales bacterium]|nr:Gfo/Idh/MocA family oxidoreductase [Victivallales bacterium]
MQQTEILSVVVVGLGRIAWNSHLPVLMAHPGYRVDAVVDPVEERLAECKEKYGINGYRSLDEALGHGSFDLAVIVSPTCFHAEQSIMALEHGCNVFCDKPAAMNMRELGLMRAAAQKNGKILEVYQPSRYSGPLLFLKDLSHYGEIGEVFLVKIMRENFTFRNDWQALRKNGGGMLLNYGSHTVDQANFLFGGRGKVLACTADRVLSKGDADDVVKILLRYGKVTVDIDINQASADRMFSLAAYGSRGSAVLPFNSTTWRVRTLKGDLGEGKELHSELAAPGRAYPAAEVDFTEKMVAMPEVQSPVVRYYENLHKAITAGERLLNTLDETENLVSMIDLAGELARSNA